MNLYKSALKTFVFKIVGLSLAFLIQILFGRLLPKELYGEYTVFVSYLNLFTIITVFGMDTNLIREISRRDDGSSFSLLKYAIIFSVILSILISTVLFFAKYINIFQIKYIIMFIVLLIGITIGKIIDGFLQGKHLVEKVTIVNQIIKNIFKILLFLFFKVIGSDLFFATIISHFIAELFSLLIRIFLCKNIVSKNHYMLSKNEKSIFIRYSLSLGIISGLVLLMTTIDKLIISEFLSFADVANYMVSQNYGLLLSVFVMPSIVFWPKISRCFSDGEFNQIKTDLQNIVKMILFLTVPMFFLISFKSTNLLMIFGIDYVTSNGKYVLIILSFAVLYDALSGPIGSIMTMSNYATLNLISNIISLILNIVISIVLLNYFGIIGVAIGTAISIIFRNVFAMVLVRIKLKIIAYDKKFFLLLIFSIFFNVLVYIFYNSLFDISSYLLDLILYFIVTYFMNGLLLLIFKKEVKTLISSFVNED